MERSRKLKDAGEELSWDIGDVCRVRSRGRGGQDSFALFLNLSGNRKLQRKRALSKGP